MLLQGITGHGAIGGLPDQIWNILWDYHESCQAAEIYYPFSFELVTTSLRHAKLFEMIVVETIRHAREEFYPHTLDWYAVQYREKTKDNLLTFALRPCDLRELVGPPKEIQQ